MRTCIYCVLSCLYSVFVSFLLCIFILICFALLPPSKNSIAVSNDDDDDDNDNNNNNNKLRTRKTCRRENGVVIFMTAA